MDKDNKNNDVNVSKEAREVLDYVFGPQELPFDLQVKLLVEDTFGLEPCSQMPEKAKKVYDALMDLFEENMELSMRIIELESKRERQIRKFRNKTIYH